MVYGHCIDEGLAGNNVSKSVHKRTNYKPAFDFFLSPCGAGKRREHALPQMR